MEAFSLLKYWRNTTNGSGSGGPTLLLDAGGADATPTDLLLEAACANATPADLLLDAGGADETPTDLLLDAGGADETPTDLLLDAAGANATSTLQSHDDHDGGPFFDLEFALDHSHEINNNNNNNNNNKQTHTSSTQLQEMIMMKDHHHHQVHQNNTQEQECDSDDGEFEFALSSCSSADPSDDLFFKGTLVSIDTTTTTTINPSQHHAIAKSQFIHKSATKFRILMLKFKNKPKMANQQQQQQKQKCLNHPPAARKFLNVEESNSQKQHIGREVPSPSPSSSSSDTALSSTNSDEKRFSKDLMQRYLNKVKPLYVRASRQLTLVGSSSANTPPPAVQQVNAKGQKQGNLQGRRYKHLGKSRSASSAVTSKRRDDSLLEEQDGIQGAILHCKRSFNASRG